MSLRESPLTLDGVSHWTSRSTLYAAAGGVLLLAALAWVTLDAASRARDIRGEVFAAERELRAAHQTVQALASLDGGHLPSGAEIETALIAIRSADGHLLRAKQRLGYLPLLLPLADLLPPADGASEVPTLIDVGQDVTSAADELLSAVLPLLQSTPEEDDAPLAERARRVFVEDGETLNEALGRLEAITPDVQRLAGRGWGGWLDPAPDALDLLDTALREVTRAQELFTAVRDGIDPLFGFDGPKTYLVAGLNESELRATGGFMGTVGIITVERGHITASEFERVYAFERELPEYPFPPEELGLMMGAGRWLPRDANWWPDFPTSAESILTLFEDHQDIRADGVIAINTLFTAQLVEVFAPIDLPEYPEVMTPENWRGVMERTLLAGRDQDERTPDGEAVDASAEESYLHPLMEHLVGRAQSASAEQLPALFAALAGAAAARDFQAYFRDAPSQAMVDTVGVTGRLQAPEDGARVIAVVDSNVSWSKVQPGISRDTTVLLREDGGMDLLVRWQNRVSSLDPLTYPRAANYGLLYDPFRQVTDRHDGVFGNYVRVYLPADVWGVRINGGTWHRITYEGGFLVVGAFVVVEDGADATLLVSYEADPVTGPLTVWKQGGQQHDTLHVLRNTGTTQDRLFDGPFSGDVRVEP